MSEVAWKTAVRLSRLLCVCAAWRFGGSRGDHCIGDICRIKGQEENVLHGFGLVTGLKGTGDGDMKATQRALAHYMELLGHHLGKNQTGQTSFDELKNIKNVALVYVMATVPTGGAQQGDLLDCVISAEGQEPRWRLPDADRDVWPGSRRQECLCPGQGSSFDRRRGQAANGPSCWAASSEQRSKTSSSRTTSSF